MCNLDKSKVSIYEMLPHYMNNRDKIKINLGES